MKYLKLYILITVCFSVTSYAQQLNWLQGSGHLILSNHGSVTAKMITDVTGNIYSVGYFSDSIVVGNTILHSSGETDIFITKHSSAGSCLWAKRAGGVGHDNAVGLTLSQNGNLYFTGTLEGDSTYPLTFDSISIFRSYPDYRHAYVAKINTIGNFEWVNVSDTGTALESNIGFDVVTDQNEDIYLVGRHEGSVYFSSLDPLSWTVSQSGPPASFIIKLNSIGNIVMMNGSNPNWQVDEAVNIEIGLNGKLYILANQYTAPYPSAFGYAKLICTDQMNFQWSLQIGDGSAGGRVMGISLIRDQNDNLICNGRFRGTITLGGITIVSKPGNYDGFIAKISSSGSPIWLIKTTQSSGYDSSIDLCPVANGSFLEAGVFTDSISIGSAAFAAKGQADHYYTLRDQFGQPVWSFTFGGAQNDPLSHITSGPAGEVYIGGYATGQVSFGGQNYPFTSFGSLFIAQVGNLLSNPAEINSSSEYTNTAYPNPTSSNITFTYPTLQYPAKLTLTDALGRTVHQQTLSHGTTQHTADLRWLPQAVYFYHLSTESGSIGSGKVAVAR